MSGFCSISFNLCVLGFTFSLVSVFLWVTGMIGVGGNGILLVVVVLLVSPSFSAFYLVLDVLVSRRYIFL